MTISKVTLGERIKLWFWYLMPAITMGKIRDRGLMILGNPDDASVIYAQAFGRNQYRDDEGLWAVRQLFEDSNFDDSETIRKLHQQGFDPGLVNFGLAKTVQRLAVAHSLPIVAQWEVITALDYDQYLLLKKRIRCVWPPKSGYFSGFHVQMESQKIAKEMGWNTGRPINVSHEGQMVRLCLTLIKLKEHPVVVPTDVWNFDSNSVQDWTTCEKKWWQREWKVRFHHILHGYVGPLPTWD
jgi:hypothetical protein